MSIYTVKPYTLIKEIAEILKDYSEIEPPEGSEFWKTAYFKELAPMDSDDFWYIRCASLLRKVRKYGPIGVNRLRKQYGGKTKDKRGLKKKAKGAGKIIRVGLQQLEDANLITLIPSQGRVCTSEGISLLERMAYSIKRS